MTPAERELYQLGRARFEQGDVEPALEVLGELLGRRGGFADLHYMVGVLLDRRGDVIGATERLRDAIKLNPSYSEALLALASVHEREGDYERSRELAERAAAVSRSAPGRLDSTTRGKLANLEAAVGDAYAQVAEHREAIDSYRKALDRCPEFHDIRFRLGVSLREAGLPHQAEREFMRALRGNPDLIEARLQLGLTYYTMGRTDRAIEQWCEALAQSPDDEDAQMYLRLVNAAPDSKPDQAPEAATVESKGKGKGIADPEG